MKEEMQVFGEESMHHHVLEVGDGEKSS
jgi:hypothetical protein